MPNTLRVVPEGTIYARLTVHRIIADVRTQIARVERETYTTIQRTALDNIARDLVNETDIDPLAVGEFMFFTGTETIRYRVEGGLISPRPA